MTTKQHPVRLPEHLAAEAKAAARGRGVSFNGFVVDAITHEIERLKADPEFVSSIEKLVAEDREILDRLASQ